VRRAAVVAVVVVAAVVAVAVTAVARRSDAGSATVATVADEKITRKQLDLAVEHFHEQADREGRPFPANSTSAYEEVQRQALRYLVALAELEVAAARLGVRVSDREVEARVASNAGGGEEEGISIRVRAEAAFVRQAARQQLLKERVYKKVGANVRVSDDQVRAYYASHRRLFDQPFSTLAASIRAQLIATKRNAAFDRWWSHAQRTLAPSVHYEKLD
jgi:hypothetical protein